MPVGALTPDLVVPIVDVKIDGTPINEELAHRMSEIRIVDYLQLPDLCSFNIGLGSADEGDPIKDSPFEIGTQIKVELGAIGDKVATPVFDGEVVTLEPRFTAGGAEVTVRAFDRAHRLNRSRKVRTFQNQSPADIVGKILGENGLGKKITPAKHVFEFMQQNNETDLDFIWRLAHRIGYEFSVQGRDGVFKPAGSSNSVKVRWPEDVQSFSPKLTAVQQVDEVNVRAWDYKSKKEIIGKASSPDQQAEIGIQRGGATSAFGRSSYTVVTEPAQTQAEANGLAKALLDRLANAYVTADGEGFGNPKIRAGSIVQIEGVGDQYGGTYRVNSTVHTVGSGGTYRTEFSSSAIQTLTGAMAASKPTDFGSQMVVGVVTNNKDPDGLGRIRVKYPTLSDSEEGWWARVLVPNAGKERGVMMLPAVNDEVLVGFEHDDTTRPYILGSLYGGKAKPGTELASDKGDFAIRSDHKMVMRSKEDLILSSDGPLSVVIAGKSELTFKDVHKETFQQNMDAQGKMNVTIKADMNLTIQAGAQLTVKGSMVNIESSGPLSIKGNPIDIKGAMVNIGGGMVNLG